MIPDPLISLNVIAQAVFDKKGFNVLGLDVRGVSTLTDFVIIAEGNVDRHVKSIGNAVMLSLKELGLRPCYTEGLATGDWVVLDYMEIMVHLFAPGLRGKYMLERLWRDGAIIDLHINTTVKEVVFVEKF